MNHFDAKIYLLMFGPTNDKGLLFRIWREVWIEIVGEIWKHWNECVFKNWRVYHIEVFKDVDTTRKS